MGVPVTMLTGERMAEQTPEPAPPNEQAVYCPNCHTLIGFYVRVEKRVWLQVGALKLRTAHGKCAVCDTEYHYCESQKQLEQLLKRLQ
jgi:RNase P subunit RPR2